MCYTNQKTGVTRARKYVVAGEGTQRFIRSLLRQRPLTKSLSALPDANLVEIREFVLREVLIELRELARIGQPFHGVDETVSSFASQLVDWAKTAPRLADLLKVVTEVASGSKENQRANVQLMIG